MRDTDYATELASASVGEACVEKILVKANNEEEIRFSWWKGGSMQPRPLDLPEDDLLDLIQEGLAEGVFSDEFLLGLVRLVLKP